MSATDADNKSPAALAAQIPLAGRVTDAANVLSQQQQAALETSLANLERNTQHQLVVVTVHSLNGQDIADYTRNLMGWTPPDSLYGKVEVLKHH